MSPAAFSCLSSLNVAGLYHVEFEVFPQSDGEPPTTEPTLLDGLPWEFTRNVASTIRRAAEIASHVSSSNSEIHTRHLFAALISGLRPSQSIYARITRMGVNLDSLSLRFRSHVKLTAPFDDLAAWDSILKTTGQIPPDSETAEPPEVEQTASRVGPRPVQDTIYSAFIPDRAAYGPRSNDPLDDSLNVRTFASHLAQLIAAKETFMPLSIGLFGAWGAGKSHFINLLDEQLRQLATDKSRVFHKHIVQIRFNAWHYLDTNLWANLVSEIFDQLFNAFENRGAKEAKKLENLKNKLADQSALAAEAKAALSKAENVRKDAETKSRSAMRERAAEEGKVQCHCLMISRTSQSTIR